MVWFLAPTVALASQQHDVLSEHLPSYSMRLLSGADGVDHWSEQSIWDEVFHGIRVVVSTHQVGAHAEICVFGAKFTYDIGSPRCSWARFC